jgi:DNA end-binding protein Ku
MAKETFDISKYKDEYREKLRELLDRKVKGEAVDLTPAPAPQAKVVDLMEALKASLARGAPAAPAPPAEAATPEAAAEEERKPPKRAASSEEHKEPAKKKKAKG